MKDNVVVRPTTIGLALANAALKTAPKIKKMDESNWVTRRVVSNLDSTKLGITTERAVNAHLSYRTAQRLAAGGIL